MTNDEIFDEFTSAERDLGPRMDIGKASPWLRKRLEHGAAHARSLIRDAAAAATQMPQIHFDWIENDDINACAFLHRGKYFIGVTAGSVIYLHSLFSRMLSNPSVLPKIGDVSKEDEARVPPVAIQLGRGNLHASGFVPIIPKDPDRQFHYEYLNHVAMGFLVAHEITHLLHGHVGYREDRLGHSGISEISWKKGESEPALTRQTLEMDADIGAAVAQAGTVIWRVMVPTQRPTGALSRFYQTPEDAMFHFAFGICPFFLMFGDDLVPAADADIEMYPPWRVRQMVAIASATYYISQHWNHELAISCQNSMKEAMLQVEHVYSLVTGEAMATEGLREAWDGTGWRHVQNKLIAHWREELYDELLPFSYIELPEAGNEIYA